MTISGAVMREGRAYSPDGALYVTPTGNASITGGTISGTNAVSDVAKWGIPFVVAPTGTMGNNGALTLGTAQPANYTGGCWMLFPAGAIAAGVPAAATWYWVVMSSFTVGVVYNSTYTSGQPGIGTTTAFATTGPGAFTGVTVETTGPSITIPAGTMGPSGRIEHDYTALVTNSANTKIIKVKHSTNVVYSTNSASVATVGNHGWIQNSGSQAVQTTGNIQAIAADTIGSTYGTVDTSAAQTLSWTFTRGTATEYCVMHLGRVAVSNGA
jgi:hypothetical protein